MFSSRRTTQAEYIVCHRFNSFSFFNLFNPPGPCFSARLPPPSKPPHRVPQGMNFALLTFIDHPNGNKLDALSRREERQQHFGFDLKMSRLNRQRRPRVEPYQPKTALRIGQCLTSDF